MCKLRFRQPRWLTTQGCQNVNHQQQRKKILVILKGSSCGLIQGSGNKCVDGESSCSEYLPDITHAIYPYEIKITYRKHTRTHARTHTHTHEQNFHSKATSKWRTDLLRTRHMTYPSPPVDDFGYRPLSKGNRLATFPSLISKGY